MKQRSFNNLTKLFNLFFASTNITISYIWLIFHLHHRHSWIDFRWQWYMNLILVPVNTVYIKKNAMHKCVCVNTLTPKSQHSGQLKHLPDTHAFFDVSWCHRISQIDDKLSKLFHINNILGIICVGIDDLGTPSNLIKSIRISD